MSPRHAFNWICVLCTAVDILAHAANIRAARVAARTTSGLAANSRKRKRPRDTSAESSRTSETIAFSPPGSPLYGEELSNSSIWRFPVTTTAPEAETLAVPSRCVQQLHGSDSPSRNDQASSQNVPFESSKERSAILQTFPGPYSGPGSFDSMSTDVVSILSCMDNSPFFKKKKLKDGISTWLETASGRSLSQDNSDQTTIPQEFI